MTGTVTGLFVPLGELVQLAGDKTAVSCKTKAGALVVQEIVTWPGAAGTILNVGAGVTN